VLQPLVRVLRGSCQEQTFCLTQQQQKQQQQQQQRRGL
jgi:hypothetical protein